MSLKSGSENGAKEPEQQQQHKVIPIRRVPFTDHSQLPPDYSATPGGTLFSTTPGGTRIIYDRNFLMQCRNSPLARTPPANLPDIPGVTRPLKPQNGEDGRGEGGRKSERHLDDPQFDMDI